MSVVFPKNNLPESSQAWAREIQKQLSSIIDSSTADEVNNAARDIQLNNSVLSLAAVVNDVKSTAQAAADAAADAQSAADAAAAAASTANSAATTANNAINGLFGLGDSSSPYDINASNINLGSITASNIDLTTGSYGITVGASGQSAYLNCFVGSGDGTTFGMAGFSGTVSSGVPSVANTGWVAAFYPRTDGGPNLGTSARRWNNVFATNATINTSDAREKTDIETSKLGLDFIEQLNPVSYKRIDGIRTHYGLIAQEIEQVLMDNNISTEEFAAFIRGDVSDPESILGLRYSEFISPMIKAIQELSAKVKQLESQING